LNRTAVDADQLVVLARRRFDPLLGYSGAEGAIYPDLSDEATRQEMCGLLSLSAPQDKPWPAWQEASEVAWLLGAPFMVKIIEGAGNSLSHVVSGLADISPGVLQLLNARWRIRVDHPADTVIAAISGQSEHDSFSDLAAAAACAARVVKQGGRIVILSRTNPTLGPGAEALRQSDNPEQGLRLLRQSMPTDLAAAFQWASAAQQASIYLLSDMPSEVVEELFATPLELGAQVQRLLGSAGSFLVLPDAHKTLAVVQENA
jgi:hypothetical protein